MAVTKKQLQGRSQGSALYICIVFVGILLVVMVVCVLVNFVFLCQQRLQAETEKLAVELAHTLNLHDRIGQMNDLSSFARQAVYTSQVDLDNEQHGDRVLEPLAAKLEHESVEAMAHAQQVRREVLSETEKLLRAKVEQWQAKQKQSGALHLFFAAASPPKLFRLELGMPLGTAANIPDCKPILELSEYDHRQQFFGKQTGIYECRKDIDLPDHVEQNKIRYSPVDRPVAGNVAPSRLIAANTFVRTIDYLNYEKFNFKARSWQDLPCAVRITIVQEVSTFLGSEMKNTLAVSAAATSWGAQVAP